LFRRGISNNSRSTGGGKQHVLQSCEMIPCENGSAVDFAALRSVDIAACGK
jgi:hypothetical protein